MNQKWNLQDIRPAQPKKKRIVSKTHRSISESGSSENQTKKPQIERAVREDIPSIVIGDGRKKTKNKLVGSIVLFFIIVGGALVLSSFLGKTELTLYPEFREPNISAEFTAYPEKRDKSLSYTVMTLEATQESQIKAKGQVNIQEQAKGTIEIIKSTKGAERLIKNTRFRSPSGLVFRIQESVVVPGSIDGVPGTIRAEVFADDVGDSYNIADGTKFDVPGFDEGGYTALYEAISARSISGFTGGFDGPQFQIEESELSTARQEIQIQLRNNLLARIQNEKPADTIAFPNSVAITYNQLPAVEYGEDLVTIREQAILQIPLFNKLEFGSFLAQEAVATYEGGDVRVDDPTLIKFNYTSPTTSSSVIANELSLTFLLTGKPLLIWEYDSEKLSADLANLPKTALENAITAHSGIRGARARITPFWKRTFPEAPEDIIIIEELKDLDSGV